MIFTCSLRTAPSKSQYGPLHTEVILVHAEICRTESKVLVRVCVGGGAGVRVALSRLPTTEDGLRGPRGWIQGSA